MSTIPEKLITAGIDVGSAAIKVAIVETTGRALEVNSIASERMLAGASERTRRRDALAVAEGLFDEQLRVAGLTRGDLAYAATTGEGEALPFRTGHFYGMTTHARGGLFLEPDARAVIDIGALHTRAVRMDEKAKVASYRMTSQCASGSGQFLENIARYLGVTLEEIGTLSQQADKPEACSSICAVLAETDVINMVSRGIGIPNILKGIHQSMAGRYLKLLVAAGVRGVVLVTGGLAADTGMMTAMQETAAEQKAALDVRCHPQSVLAGALGAALWGGFRVRRLAEKGTPLPMLVA
ncbi:MAG: benzoyl-CoA reductase subunit D [Vicinamibacteria bacterium]|nr:benzoyl-CoA reductase subunit D [Vicinamibacteria bacterium]